MPTFENLLSKNVAHLSIIATFPGAVPNMLGDLQMKDNLRVQSITVLINLDCQVRFQLMQVKRHGLLHLRRFSAISPIAVPRHRVPLPFVCSFMKSWFLQKPVLVPVVMGNYVSLQEGLYY